jgi:hypothetical protein
MPDRQPAPSLNTARLSELFGGARRFQLLRTLFLDPYRAFTLTQAASDAAVDKANARLWLNRWATLGLVERRVDGRNITYTASHDPLLAGLHDLVLRNDALIDDIRNALPASVDTAVVFGSSARGEERADSDVDVLAIGRQLSAIKVNAALRPVGRKHRRIINAVIYTPDAFRSAVRTGDGFAMGVLASPVVPLRGRLDLIR